MEATKIKASWSELLVDLLGEIMGKLFFPDQVRACAVCKNWFLQSNKHPNKQTHMFPWFFRFTLRSRVDISHKEISCQLYDPFNPTPILSEFVTDTIQKSDEWSPIFRCRIAIKYDCVLFSGEREIDEIKLTQFFLYSIPSTEKIPTVPDLRDLDHGCDIHNTITTFTSHPKSPNCVFFVLRKYPSRKITISSLKVKEQRWITKEFTREIESNIGFNIVFIRGILYCLSGKGNLESYELATGEWNLLFNSDITGWNLLVNSDETSFKPCKMLESNGDLLLVYLEKSEIEINYCCVLVFDLCEMNWVPKTSLTDRALFLGHNSFSVSAADETRNILANKIYYIDFGSCKVYSFRDGKFYWCEEGSGLAGWDANVLDGEGFWIQPRDYFGK